MIRVGPAGWSYPDWEGRVYPRRKPKGFHPLRQIARWFDCVEINSSFYGVPNARNSEHWAELVRDRPRFRFTAKLQQIFTHEPLSDDARQRDADVRAFHAGIRPLADAQRLAGLLVQFPQSFRRSTEGEERLRWIAETFGGHPLVLELRDRSWFAPDALALAHELGYSPCWLDFPSAGEIARAAEDFALAQPSGSRALSYLRLHGRNAGAWFDPRAGRDRKYDYLYEPTEVREIVQTTRRLAQGADETYVIANNHFSGKAVATALEILAGLADGLVPGPVEILDAFPRLRSSVRPDGQDSLFPP